MKTILTILCILSAMCAAGADKKASTKKISLSEAELRTLATSVPDVKSASMLHSVAMATSNNVERKQEYLEAAAACLIACDKNDIYKKHIKGKLQNAAEFEDKLKTDCKQCSATGIRELRCYDCIGNRRCASCKGSGRRVTFAYNRPCHKCKGSGRCHNCDGKGTLTHKCFACAGTGRVLSKEVAAGIYRDSCNAIADSVAGKTCCLEKSKIRHSANHLDVVLEAEKLFAKRCKAENGEAHVEYEGVLYAIVKNTVGSENFVIAMDAPISSNLAGFFVILPSSDSSCNRWYAAVEECIEKLKSWVRVASKNKIAQVRKEIPICTDAVCAYSNAISRGRGQQELFRKSIREPITPLAAMQVVRFIGAVKANRDDFSSYRVSIRMISGDYFDGEIFYTSGTIEEIDAKTVEFLTFVNPKSLESVREAQTKREALFY